MFQNMHCWSVVFRIKCLQIYIFFKSVLYSVAGLDGIELERITHMRKKCFFWVLVKIVNFSRKYIITHYYGLVFGNLHFDFIFLYSLRSKKGKKFCRWTFCVHV